MVPTRRNSPSLRFQNCFGSFLLMKARRNGRGGRTGDTPARVRRAQGQVPGFVSRIVRRIVSRFAPERVILFGSRANGTARADSDVDLLVVMPVSGSKRRKMVEIGVALHDFAIAKDILITTPEDFDWRKDVVGTIEYPAAHEGVLLYAKP